MASSLHKVILIVDDEEDIRETLRDAFEEEGYVVEVAADGQHALEMLERITPSIVLLDLLMPVLDGNAVFARMRADERWSAIPVIFSTSDPARAPAGELVIRKPVDLTRLITTVARTCAS